MKKYEITRHAVDQAVERLGKQRANASNDIQMLMQTAVYQGITGTGRVFDHHPSRTRMILAREIDRVITVYSMDSRKEGTSEGFRPLDVSNEILAAAHATIKRELTKARRRFTSEYRKLQIEQAELGVEIAQAHVNKARCKAPHTQALIQARIDATQEYYDAVQAKIDGLQTEYSRTKTEAQAFLGSEVTS